MNVKQLFDFKTGSLPSLERTEPGNVPLVYGGIENNGIARFVRVQSEDQIFKPPLITVSYLGNAFVQVVPFTTSVVDKSNIMILEPKCPMSLEEMYFHAFQINRTAKFGFHYSRRMNMRQLGKLSLLPFEADHRKIEFKQMLPKPTGRIPLEHNLTYERFLLTDIFTMNEGGYHAVAELSEGNVPFVSCTTENNGIVGYFDIPEESTYKNAITIACDGDRPLYAFYHPYCFNAQDNVVICKPKGELHVSTIFFIISQLRRQLWRFSYGRKCYSNKMNKISIKLPVQADRSIDEAYIERLAANCYGWNVVSLPQNWSSTR